MHVSALTSQRQSERDYQRELQRNKSVDNAKQYCISKIIGRLDTKRELERVSRYSYHLKIARSQLNQRYQEAAAKSLNQRTYRSQVEYSKQRPTSQPPQDDDSK